VQGSGGRLSVTVEDIRRETETLAFYFKEDLE
jgi:hypothetical protein